jgi:hypothetical protein
MIKSNRINHGEHLLLHRTLTFCTKSIENSETLNKIDKFPTFANKMSQTKNSKYSREIAKLQNSSKSQNIAENIKKEQLVKVCQKIEFCIK